MASDARIIHILSRAEWLAAKSAPPTTDRALGGKLGLFIMVLVAVLLGVMLAAGGVL